MGRTPLHSSVIREKKDVILFLLQKEAYINSQDNEFNTPLHVAVENRISY